MKIKPHFSNFWRSVRTLYPESRVEAAVLAAVSLTFLIGIWHGFPFTNVVADEWFFSGAVLHAMDSHSILPLPFEVQYGTITYYINYVFISIGLGILWIFKGFSLSALKLLVIQNPFVAYLISRLVSFIIAIVCLFGINSVMKRYVSDYRSRLILVSVLFGTLLVNIIFHTSKVWVLSTVLLVGSLYFLVDALENTEKNSVKKSIWLSILFSFLASANFPLMGFSLLCVPVLFYFKREDRSIIIWSACVGFAIAALIILSNFSGVAFQIKSIIFDYTLSPGAIQHNASFIYSAMLHIKKVMILFPVLLTLIIYAALTGKIRHRKLFTLSVVYFLLYVCLLIIIDRWSLTDKASLRYMFPVPFFMAFIIASYDIPWKKILLIPLGVVIVYLLPTLYYLSVQTTSQEAAKYIRNNFSTASNTVIINHVGADMELPQNKSSSMLVKKGECASKCRATIQYDLEKDFMPLVLDSHADDSKTGSILKNSNIYLVEREASSSPDLKLVASFTNPVEDLNYYSADNTGNYFDFSYFQLSNFGPNIYIYKLRR